jgi:hypothetical protein
MKTGRAGGAARSANALELLHKSLRYKMKAANLAQVPTPLIR